MRVQRWTIISLCLTAKPDGNIAVWWKINHRVKSVVTQIKWNVIIYEIQMVLTEWKSDGSYWLLKLMYSFMVLSLRLAFQLIHMSEIIAKTIKKCCATKSLFVYSFSAAVCVLFSPYSATEEELNEAVISRAIMTIIIHYSSIVFPDTLPCFAQQARANMSSQISSRRHLK